MSSPATNLSRQSANVEHVVPFCVTSTMPVAIASESVPLAASDASVRLIAQSYACAAYTTGALASAVMSLLNRSFDPVVPTTLSPLLLLGSSGETCSANRGSSTPSRPTIVDGCMPAAMRSPINGTPSPMLTMIVTSGLDATTVLARSSNSTTSGPYV